MKSAALAGVLFLAALSISAQVINPGLMDTLSGEKLKSITVGGYVDVYYGTAPGLADTDEMPYAFNMSKLDQIALNLAFLDLRYSTSSVRARLTPGFGTYMNANYASEPASLKNIVEASAGIRPWKNKQIWLDAGIFGSPFTNESAVSKDHLLLSRSMGPEYTPYYLAGVRVTMPAGSKVNLYMYLLNGWQQISNPDKAMSVATQVEYRPDARNLINWNTYIGKDDCAGGIDCGTRYFTDLYWIYAPEGRFSCTSNVYYGRQNLKKSSTGIYRTWWQANITAKYKLTAIASLSGRLEYFSDPYNIQVPSYNSKGIMPFKTAGAAACLNLKVHENALFRMEARRFFSEKGIYQGTGGIANKQLTWLLTGLSVWF